VAAAGRLTTSRFDYDGDGRTDFLAKLTLGAYFVVQSSDDTSVDLSVGNPTVFRDLITSGNLTDASGGPEVLGLTQTGRLKMFAYDDYGFDSPLWTGSGWQMFNQVAAVGDTNGDGFGDLLARTPSGDLYFYKSTGDAASPFAARVRVGTGFGIYDQLIGAGDFTGTGRETLVARDLNGDLWMYLLDGNAARPVATRVKIGTGWNVYAQIIGTGDDSTHQGGIFGQARNGDLYGYVGRPGATGTATLTPRVLVGSNWLGRTTSGQGHTAVRGKNNLYGVTRAGDVYYYSAIGNGDLRVEGKINLQDSGLEGLQLGSSVSFLEDDEEPLLAIGLGGNPGQLVDWHSKYEWTHSYGRFSGNWDGYNLVLGPGDLSGDGRTDLLARDGSGVLWLFTSRDVYGTFDTAVRVGAGWGGYDRIVGAGDITGDGYGDFVARDTTGHLYLYQGTGSGTGPFAARVLIGTGWNTYTKVAAPGDLDGDGRADLVGADATGALYRYSATGKTGTATYQLPRVQIGFEGWNAYTWLL
jgi:hypothetical protein